MKECLIITGGDFAPLPEGLSIDPSALIIACDRGYLYTKRMGISPQLIFGDFDSSLVPEDQDAKIHIFSADKDDTDTMLAVRYALSRNYHLIHIACAFGGRLDHAYSNIQTASYVASKGGIAYLYGSNDIATVFGASFADKPVKISFPKRDGFSLSVFSLSDSCEGITISGTKYEVNDITLINRDPLGTSNVWTSPAAVITLQNGIIMVMQSRLTHGEHI